MKKTSLTSAFIILVGLGLTTSLAFAQAPARKVFGKGHPFTLEELPAGQLKSKLQSLDPKARGNAMKWLHTFTFADFDAAEHLRADLNGGIYIACPHAGCEHEGSSNTSTASGAIASGAMAAEDTTTQPTTITEPPIAPASTPNSSPPAYNSKPGATRHIYLDFNGAIVTGTQWNAERGVTSWDCLPWSYDADLTTFSDTEQGLIKRTWERIAEDYAPFDVNVTTDVAYDPDNYTGDKNKVGWVLYTPKTDKNGVNCPHIDYAGGVAYVGVYGDTNYYTKYQPAWGRGASTMTQLDDMAEVGSHEMGHNMGLSHDGTPTLTYYAGHNATSTAPSWGPIMGSGFARDVSQWSKGEYYNADMFQDDLAIISARVPYRADDHGDSFATATTWSNPTVNQAGIVERTGNADYFKFTTGAGLVSLSAGTYRDIALNWGCNLDIQLELYDSTQTLVTSNNPAADTNASISATLAAGTYYLVLKPSAAGTPLATSPSGYTIYASLGQYTITGSFPSSAEIAVEQPAGTNLTDGVSSINCGSATIPASATPVTFTVKNLGISNLTGLALSKDGTHSADFTLGSLGSATLAPGASTTFTVTFTPGATGARTAAIHITSNDSDENPFDIALTGTGYTVGTLAVTPAGNLTSSGKYGGPFSPSSLQYTLSNTGITSIDWTAAKTSAWVNLSAASGTLAAGATTTVTISINATANTLALGSYSDTVTFTNGTNGNGNTTRGVSLTVTPDPYPVSYNGNGNTGGTAPSSQLKTHDVGLVLSGPGTLVRSGFSFAGWNTAANGGGTLYLAGATYTVNAAVTLYAQWNAIPTANAGNDQSAVLTGGTWSPQDLSPGLWLDASKATINAGTVSITNDGTDGGTISGPGSLAANGIGSLQAVQFNGTSQYLTGNYTNTGTTLTAFFVGKSLNSTQTAYAGMMSIWANGQASDWNNVGSAVLLNQNNTTANSIYSHRNAVLSSTTGTLTSAFLAATNFNGTTNTVFLNGTAATGVASSGSFSAAKVSLGGRWSSSTFGNYWNGNFGEAIICNTSLSVSDRQKTEGYLAHKWGTTGSLPAGHPYKTDPPSNIAAVANLNGTVSDPSGDSLTTTWTMVSGPGSVVFGNASAVDTTATFTVAGTYTLRLTASDSFGSIHDECVINVGSVASGYTIAYDGNGNTGGAAPVDGSSPYTPGTTVTVLGNTGSLIKDGYTFAGWNTAANGSGSTYNSGATFAMPAADTTLHAQWTANSYTVTFDAQGGTGGSISLSATYDSAMPTATAPTRSGYTFGGYYTATNGGGTQYYTAAMASAANWGIDANTTLYAQWNALPTVNAGTDQSVAMSASVPWTPAQTTTAAWFDASDASTVIRNGTAVTNWNDKSGNGRNLAQTTTANQPVYTSTLNGLGVITYDGSNDRLSHTGSTVSFSGIQCAFVGMQETGGINYSGPVQWSGTDGFNLRRNNTNPQLQLEINSGSGSAYSTAAAPTSFSTPYIGGMSWDGSQAIPYANGVGATAANVTGTIDVNTVAAGTANYFKGYIAEIIHCNSNDSSVRQKLEGYLAHKWGLTANLPTDHPYKTAAPGSPTAVATLDGTVSNPDSVPTTLWTKISGPGTVTFGNASAVDTTATFTVAGSYTLRLTATGPGGSVTDDVVITVYDPSSVGPLDHFAISAIASPQTVGVPITGITLTAQDISNNTVTGFTGTVTFGGTGGFTGTSANFTAGVLTGVSVTPTTAGSNLTFTVNDGSAHTGSATITSIRTAYTTWSGGTAFDADTNGDGVKDGLAWVLGASSPSGSMQGKLPAANRSGDYLRLTFRCLKSTKRGGVLLKLQSSSDLGVSDPWTSHEAAVPDGDQTVNNVIFDTTDDGDFIQVTADIPATGTKLFSRIMVE